jgi:isocitrate/isopropylmalate dehydrogenase
MSERYRIALLSGDGIGPEVTTATEWVGKNLANPLTLLGSGC